MKIVFSFIISLLLLSCIVFAHPGQTDANGGHTVSSTGEYHYHHGYPAHQHTVGQCPYNFVDHTGMNSGTGSPASSYTSSSASSSKISVSTSSKSSGILNIVISVAAICFVFFIPIINIIGAIIDFFRNLFSKPE